jgi:hypothetical protein
MPSNTITEFRDRNPRGRDKRRNKNRCPSPTRSSFRKGNSTSCKGFCSRCNTSLINSINRKVQVLTKLKCEREGTETEGTYLEGIETDNL